jgi:hypothetical protein
VRHAAAALALSLASTTATALGGGRDAPPSGASQRIELHVVLSTKPWGTQSEREHIYDLLEDVLNLLESSKAGTLTRDRIADGLWDITIEAVDARAAWKLIERKVRAFGGGPGSEARLVTPAGEERIPIDGTATGSPAATPPP